MDRLAVPLQDPDTTKLSLAPLTSRLAYACCKGKVTVDGPGVVVAAASLLLLPPPQAPNKSARPIHARENDCFIT